MCIERLNKKLEFVNEQIKIYKKNLLQDIEKEEMVPATVDLLMIRDLKEQQLLLKRLISEIKDEEI